MMPEYDNLADIYNPWSAADPAANRTLSFYTDVCCGAEGNVVELGIGNGRIAIAIAQRSNKQILGIDISEKMLSQCELNAKAKGVDHLIQLLKADFRDFKLKIPAKLIIMPFRTIGHLLTLDDKLVALNNIYRQLAPGGEFIFDHWIYNEKWARFHNGVPRLMCKVYDSKLNKYRFVWDTYMFNYNTQITDCIITVEESDPDGTVLTRRHNSLSFSWIEPDQVIELLQKVGFEVIELYGGFEKQVFNSSSRDQIWVVRRPIV